MKGDTSFAGLEMNDYDSATLHIPYGPGWSASKIENLIYTADLKMSCFKLICPSVFFNPKNKFRRLHRHPALFGTAEECLEDCRKDCPEPERDRALQESEDAKHIRGRVSDTPEVDLSLDGWPRRFAELEHGAQAVAEENKPKMLQKRDDRLDKAKDEYLATLEDALRSHGAKTWQELHPSPSNVKISVGATAANTEPIARYGFLAFGGTTGGTPPSYQLPLFD
ncbi:hypothetical protein PAXRUDRAFT_23765 [Paxillus rubicundulus Ve08.2h10]|uniref:Uncharacterized protein n=1 Tax=Paxillus rubicundulus Ve08.2h10 TaxID=930991 RepID=A0A0D0E4N2_9AGAM|nr:hypothetical protein PAXRUDRAFT_23765 [Paxillus rubicundulus Ve08.2h10]